MDTRRVLDSHGSTAVFILDGADFHAATEWIQELVTRNNNYERRVLVLVQESVIDRVVRLLKFKLNKLNFKKYPHDAVDNEANVSFLNVAVDCGAEIFRAPKDDVSEMSVTLVTGINISSKCLKQYCPTRIINVVPFRTAAEGVQFANSCQVACVSIWSESISVIKVIPMLKKSLILINGLKPEQCGLSDKNAGVTCKGC